MHGVERKLVRVLGLVGAFGLIFSVGCGKKPGTDPNAVEGSGDPPTKVDTTDPVTAPPGTAPEKTPTKPETTAPVEPPKSLGELMSPETANPAEVEVAAFNGSWVGHDSEGQLVTLELGVAAKTYDLEVKRFDNRTARDDGTFEVNETTKQISWGKAQVAMTKDKNLFLAYRQEPVGGKPGGNRTAVLVAEGSEAAVEFSEVRQAPPLNDGVVADFESFKAGVLAGGEFFSSSNTYKKLQNLPIPPIEEDFVWLIRPKGDQLVTFPTTVPNEAIVNGKHFADVEMEAYTIPGKLPPTSRIKMVYDAVLDSRKTERRSMSLFLNPGVAHQDFKFDYLYYKRLQARAYAGGGTFAVYLVEPGEPDRIISNIIFQKFVFD